MSEIFHLWIIGTQGAHNLFHQWLTDQSMDVIYSVVDDGVLLRSQMPDKLAGRNWPFQILRNHSVKYSFDAGSRPQSTSIWVQSVSWLHYYFWGGGSQNYYVGLWRSGRDKVFYLINPLSNILEPRSVCFFLCKLKLPQIWKVCLFIPTPSPRI